METRDAASRRYGPLAVALHWASAILAVVLWVSGQLNGLLPRGPLRLGIWSSHIVLGALLGLLLLASLAGHWRRARSGAAGAGWPAMTMHAMLYGCLAVIIGLGVWQAFLRGFDMFGLFHLPTLPGGKPLTAAVNGWHVLLADALMVLASIHSVAALCHHYVRGDAVLAGMFPRLRARSPSRPRLSARQSARRWRSTER